MTRRKRPAAGRIARPAPAPASAPESPARPGPGGTPGGLAGRAAGRIAGRWPDRPPDRQESAPQKRCDRSCPALVAPLTIVQRRCPDGRKTSPLTRRSTGARTGRSLDWRRTAVSPNTGTSPTVGATHASPLRRRSGPGLNYHSAAQTPSRRWTLGAPISEPSGRSSCPRRRGSSCSSSPRSRWCGASASGRSEASSRSRSTGRWRTTSARSTLSTSGSSGSRSGSRRSPPSSASPSGSRWRWPSRSRRALEADPAPAHHPAVLDQPPHPDLRPHRGPQNARVRQLRRRVGVGEANAALAWVGLGDLHLLGERFEPLAMLYNNTAVVFGLVYVHLPFMVLPLYAALDRLERSYLEASLDLGRASSARSRPSSSRSRSPGSSPGSSSRSSPRSARSSPRTSSAARTAR